MDKAMNPFETPQETRANVARNWPAESPVLKSWDKVQRLIDAGAAKSDIVLRIRMTLTLAEKALEVLCGDEMWYRGYQESMEAISEVERIQEHAESMLESMLAFLAEEK